MKKKIIIIVSILALLVIVAAIIWGPKIVKYEKLKKGICGAVETLHLGYCRYTPSLPGNCEETDEYYDGLNELVDDQFEFKNLHILAKYEDDEPEYWAELYKANLNANFEVSKAVEYEIEVDVREKYDYDENNSVIIEEYSYWNENSKENNHKWSEWHTEEHSIEALKIDGKWYYECVDDEN